MAAAAAVAVHPRQPLWDSPLQAAQPQDEKKPGKLPPLTIDDDCAAAAGRRSAAAEGQQAVAPSVAENEACYVCHTNFQEEELVTQHAVGDTGCVDCHGKSYDHRNDENNITPPDIMFPRDKIEESCVKCHDTHDAPAAKVIARLQERIRTQPKRRVWFAPIAMASIAWLIVPWCGIAPRGELLTGKPEAAEKPGPVPGVPQSLGGDLGTGR